MLAARADVRTLHSVFALLVVTNAVPRSLSCAERRLWLAADVVFEIVEDLRVKSEWTVFKQAALLAWPARS